MNDLIGITIISGTSKLIRQRTRKESYVAKGTIDVRYEMHQHPTFFSIKIFHSDQQETIWDGSPMPVKVHVGTKAYIERVWSKTLKL